MVELRHFIWKQFSCTNFLKWKVMLSVKVTTAIIESQWKNDSTIPVIGGKEANGNLTHNCDSNVIVTEL